MSDKTVLGIHSYVGAQTEGSFNQFVDGHAWISVTRNGQTEVYGLWPDDHPHVPDNGNASDIRRGLEAGYPATASRYFELTPEQSRELDAALKENVTWRYTNTCASWASETTERITGQRIDADDTLGFETPRKLIETLRGLEKKQPTAPDTPQPPVEPSSSSSFGALDTPSSPPDDGMMRELARLVGDPQRQQAWADRIASHQRGLAEQETREVAVARTQDAAQGLGRA